MTLRRLTGDPLLVAWPGFVSDHALQELLDLVEDTDVLEMQGVEVRRSAADVYAELDLDLDPSLSALAERLDAVLGTRNPVRSLRLQRFHPGSAFPPHLDDYEIDGQRLLATALLCLEAPDTGGETLFIDAPGGPLAVPHRAGQLTAWINLQPDGRPDPSARHLGALVRAGTKTTLGWFVYGDLEALQDLRGHFASAPPLDGLAGLARGAGRSLAIVDDGVPAVTVDLLVRAASSLGIQPLVLDAAAFDFHPDRRMLPGDLLFRPATSSRAHRVEQHLWRPGVASFTDNPTFACVGPEAALEQAGVPQPATVWLTPGGPALEHLVELVGGLPVVVKVPGLSHGHGVLRADTLPALRNLLDFVHAGGHRPALRRFVADAVHWRVVVVGDQAVTAYRNPTPEGDFRSQASLDPADYTAEPPPGVLEVAVQACQAMQVGHGGVDVLVDPAGALFVLEVNYPCFYPQAQRVIGVEIAGAMVDHLLERAEAWPAPLLEPA